MTPEYFVDLFPMFKEIKDAELRNLSAKAMADAANEGGWSEETIALCPVTLRVKDCDVSWIEHVGDVTSMCIMEFDYLYKYYQRHNVPFDRDAVIAGALLHDIGKLLEAEYHEGSVRHRPGSELMRHPLSGALIASKAGLPDRIVHLIAVHSFEGDRSFQTPESSFVRSVDMFVYKNSMEGVTFN